MKPRFLMCPPQFFGVRYSINPWMEGQIGRVDPSLAQRQWTEFYQALQAQAEVDLLDPYPHVPDLVFTANAGLLGGGLSIPSRFKHEERRREEPLFRHFFETRGGRIVSLPKNIYFEGAGDALFQPGENLLWAGFGFRTDREAHQFLADHFRIKVVSLGLAQPRFYHLDTCLCPLADGQVMYYPGAFDAESVQRIEAQVPPEKRIVVSRTDAEHFACNSVLVHRSLYLNHAGPELRQTLEDKGYTCIIQPVTEFLKAGGANKCLTLALP
ncbi:MAG: hypothetical protein GWM98_08040 [Nitrospinaceae bacterium]|nr:hypothetical protein [Nitrospinaceae bacterium]NIR54454.1 hypothetical protein [Nitrospinaceae bacterium]NIS84873.1 hypothetical protein [Nitrospinaceae bacterium]NIT81685.1 hypothetical protein [Nitrospinaceae bacterium]NIU43956.1 hypothetical protein [Nitrospinaceae bacterium]